MIFELVKDFAAVLEAMPNEHPRRRILKLLDEAVRRDGQFIDRHPTTLFQCLWNLCWWYDCPEAAVHYEEPKGGWTEPPPWESGDCNLSDLLEDWRVERRHRFRGMIWVRSLRPPPVQLGTAQQMVLRGHEGRIDSVDFSPDGARIVSGSSDKTLRFWETSTGAESACLKGHEGAVRCVDFSPDGVRVASGSEDLTVRVWDAASGAELACFKGHEQAVTSVSFSPSGSHIVSGSSDRTVRLWDTAAGTQVACFTDHEESVTSVVFSPSGWQIASASRDGIVRLWDVTNSAVLTVIRCASARCLAFSPDGSQLACGSGSYPSRNGNLVGVHDLETGRIVRLLGPHEAGVNSVAFSPDGTRIISGSGYIRNNYTDLLGNEVRVWNSSNDSEMAVLRGHEAGVSSVAFSPDGRRIVSGSLDMTVRVWDADSGSALVFVRGRERDHINRVIFSADGKRLLSLEEFTVRMWYVESGTELAAFHEYWGNGIRNNATFSPDGARVASGSENHTVCVWETTTGAEVACLRGHAACIESIAFSPDGARIASGSGDGTVRLWDAASGVQLACMEGHQRAVSDIVFSSDGSRVASGSADGTVRVWEADSGVELAYLRVHGKYVNSIAFSPDGSRIASGSWDGTVRIWDASTGAELVCLNDHNTAAESMHFSPDGHYLVSGGWGEFRVWESRSGEFLGILRDLRDASAVGKCLSERSLAVPLAVDRGIETVIEHAAGLEVAYFPEPLCRLQADPSGRTWVSDTQGRHLCIIRLEGEIGVLDRIYSDVPEER